MIFKGVAGLVVLAAVIWFFWMTYVALRRTKPPKNNEKDSKQQ